MYNTRNKSIKKKKIFYKIYKWKKAKRNKIYILKISNILKYKIKIIKKQISSYFKSLNNKLKQFKIKVRLFYNKINYLIKS